MFGRYLSAEHIINSNIAGAGGDVPFARGRGDGGQRQNRASMVARICTNVLNLICVYEKGCASHTNGHRAGVRRVYPIYSCRPNSKTIFGRDVFLSAGGA